MYDRLFIGKKLINLIEVDSTNTFMKGLIANSDREVEGIVVAAKRQINGRGQQGNVWESEDGKNLTFSVYLKPNLVAQNQFILSKVISLGIIDCLDNLGLTNLKIKWPNDIYCNDRKISGILIENLLKGNKIYNSIVGVGLNVNQTTFNSENNPTSILNELGEELELDALLNQMLFFIEKRYVLLKSGKETLIDKAYIEFLFGLNELRKFKIKTEIVEGEILGVSSIGKIQLNINNQKEEFNLKEIEFLID